LLLPLIYARRLNESHELGQGRRHFLAPFELAYFHTNATSIQAQSLFVVALPIFRLLSFYKKKMVTPEYERWRTHVCESRINQDAAAHHQATCHQRYRNKNHEKIIKKRTNNELYYYI
jgi:hypothetical protein